MSNLVGTATRYRSRYTGRQIDEMLGSIQDKIDTTYIVNDWSGGTNLVASAELAKNLHQRLERLKDPNYIKELYLSIPNSDIFTKQDREKLERSVGFFLGSFSNAAERNLAIDTIGFSGGEITFLLDDGDGQQELSYWDINTLTWKKSIWTPETNGSVDVPSTGSDTVVLQIDRTKYSAGQYMIKGTNGTLAQMVCLSALVAGDDTFWTSYAVGNLNMVVKNLVMTATNINITVTAPLGTLFKFKRLGEV